MNALETGLVEFDSGTVAHLRIEAADPHVELQVPEVARLAAAETLCEQHHHGSRVVASSRPRCRSCVAVLEVLEEAVAQLLEQEPADRSRNHRAAVAAVRELLRRADGSGWAQASYRQLADATGYTRVAIRKAMSHTLLGRALEVAHRHDEELGHRANRYRLRDPLALRELVRDEQLPATARRTLLVVAALADEHGHLLASWRTLATAAELDRDALRYALEVLEERGHLVADRPADAGVRHPTAYTVTAAGWRWLWSYGPSITDAPAGVGGGVPAASAAPREGVGSREHPAALSRALRAPRRGGTA